MISLSFTRRFWNCFGVTCLLVFAWKFILLALTAQPIPANDAFGYDGAVVNYWLNGHYCNPSLIIPFPYSGTKVFSIYPPVYQGVLCGWMGVFGTSALSAMWFHLVLFGLYALTLLAIFRRLQAPAWVVNVAGLFLLGITFDDRPDGLAQLFGMLSVYAWVRSVEPAKVPCGKWSWLAAGMVVVAFFTTPEIGGLYFGWLWLLTLGAAAGGLKKFPAPPMAMVVIAPFALVALVKYGRPDWWAGFMEHAGQTPSFTHLRLPSAGDLIKIVRTIPAILLIAGLSAARLVFAESAEPACAPTPGVRPSPGAAKLIAPAQSDFPPAPRRSANSSLDFFLRTTPSEPRLLLYAGLLVSLGLLVAVLFLFAADWILILAHFQPLIVGAFLTLEARRPSAPAKWLLPVLAGLVLLVSVRAIGMTTWGVACARDVSYANALQIVRTELDKTPAGSTNVMSTAYLYEATTHSQLHFIHEDWTHRADEPPGKLHGDTQGLIRLKPATLILTQFDYYRRYQPRLAELQTMPSLVTITITNTARTPAPDSFPLWRQVVQHVSWAPVLVEFNWKDASSAKHPE